MSKTVSKRLTAAERQRRYRAKYPGRSAENWRRYAASEKGTLTVLLNYAHDRSQREGVEFSLSRDWLAKQLVQGCALSGIAFVRQLGGGRHPFAPSIDRIKAGGGYTHKNCRVICLALNQALSNWGDEVYFTLAEMSLKRRENVRK
jgi:hypothetical protein